jgi:site-specific DNA-adenine methylase
MVRFSNIITRIGSKQNDIKFFKQYLPLDVKTVVEPFAGSFAVIKNFYVDFNKYDFHINDNDETLYYLYHNPQELIDMKLKLSKLYIEEYKSKEYDAANKFKNVIQGIEMHDHLKMWVLKNMFIRGSLFKPISSDNFNPTEINILKNALITKLNYTEIFDLYRDDPNAFYF